jgi:glycosyltransferase involved in cell wall biosynthesis
VARLLYKSAFSRMPVVFFQNEDDRALFLSGRLVRDRQARLLPGSGIDLSRFVRAPLPERQQGEQVFLLIARLLRDKGVGEFVQAARQLRVRFPRIRFQLLGAAGDENRTAFDRASVERWVGERIVEYLGETDDVRPFIAQADCVVLPSYREGMPRTLLEAAAMGRPMVASDVPGCRQIVRDGDTGLLCPPRDAEGLARAIEHMVELGADAREVMGRRARTLVEREFDVGRVVDAYLEAGPGSGVKR